MNVIEKIGGIYCNRLTLGWHYASGLWQDMAIPSNYQYAKYLDILSICQYSDDLSYVRLQLSDLYYCVNI
jgi:hypothetical protein